MARAMKDSGIEWIGEIPEEWEASKLKYISSIYTGNSIKDEEKEQYEDSENAIPYLSSKDINATFFTADYENGMYVKEDDISFKRANPNSTLMCVEGGSAGKKKTFLSQQVAFVNKLCCFEPKNTNGKYLFYCLCSPNFEEQFRQKISGLIGGVSVSELKDFWVAVPPLPEQRHIADFLDSKCAEIDRVVAETEKTIEEYKTLKQSVITETVTKGVRGDRPMKDSGIAWIGEIPEEWNVKVAFQLFNQVKNKNVGLAEKNLLSLSYGKIKRKSIDTIGGLLPENFDGYNIIEANDIVLRLTDLQNDHTSLRVGLSNERGIITSAYLTLRNFSDNLPLFLFYYLHTFDVCKGFYGMGSGVRQGLNWDELKLLKIALPTIDEQKEIIAYLDTKCAEIDKLIEAKQKLLAEMETYKKSVIYEFVTGKKEI